MKNKICMICKGTILIPRDEYVINKHQSKEDINLSKGYYHIKCFRDRLNGAKETSKIQRAALNFIKGASKKVGIEQEEEVVII